MDAYGDEMYGDEFEADDCRSLAVREWSDYVVYILLCPNTKRVRYVGSTRQVGNRRRAHTKQVHATPKCPVQLWTNELISAGTPPLFRVIVHVRSVGWALGSSHCRSISRPEHEVRTIEKRIIGDCLAAGCDLLNVASTPKFTKNRKPRTTKA